MQKGTLTFTGILILFALFLGFQSLYPTYQWYYRMPQEEKKIADTPKEEEHKIVEDIELAIQDIRDAIKDKSYFKLTKDKKSSTVVWNIQPEAGRYILDITPEQLKAIIQTTNKEYKDLDGIEKKFLKTKELVSQLDKILEIKKLKKKTIKLGLDLAGGVHFILGIDEEKMKEQIEALYQNDLNKDKVKEILKKQNPQMPEAELNEKAAKKVEETKKLLEERLKDARENGIKDAYTKIISRVDKFGVTEPSVKLTTQNTIIVDLPGEKNKDAAKEIITKVGRMTFQLVNEEFYAKLPADYKTIEGYIKKQEIGTVLKHPELKEDTVLLPVMGVKKISKNYQQTEIVGYLPLYKKIELEGDKIIAAKVEPDELQAGRGKIDFELNSEGADIFAAVTKANIKKRLAIVLDGKIQSAPTIQTEILGGKAQITGSYTLEEANTLAAILRSGSLPIALKIEEEKIIGPSLGADQIDRGVKAIFIAFILVSVFMILYYKWSGFNANLAQVLNIFFTLAILASLGASLTLPGIAGMVLTIGMSVDANILINERIKEELALGRSIESALVHGYQRAFVTIFDANLTTIIIGVVLAATSTPSVQGFGVTLIIGLLTNMFSAVLVTYFIYSLFIRTFRIKKLSI